MGETRKRRDGRATMDRVVEFARAELAEHGPVGFNLDRVIAVSGVSRGSIYHHFGSRAGLVTAVEALDLLKAYRAGNDATRRVIEEATTGSALIDWLSVALEFGGGDDGRRSRARRIASLAAAEQIPALREVLSEYQTEGVAFYAETLEIARRRGLIDPVVPITGIANLIQSVLLGRALVDLLDDEAQDAAWAQAAVAAISAVLRPTSP
jgi:AcrR family transcriptional regulator